MLGDKIDALNFLSTIKLDKLGSLGAPAQLLAGVLLLLSSSCVMTKAQGDILSQQVRDMNGEVAKLQSVRHDMEVMLSGQLRDLFDRLAKLERQFANLRESLLEGSSKSGELVAEVQNLRNQLEEAQYKYRNLEQDQKSLAENQMALTEAQKKIAIPLLKDDHFGLAKKYFSNQKYQDAIFLLDEFIKEYPKEKELVGQSYFLIGESNRKIAEGEKVPEEISNYYKKSVLSYQKIVELYSGSTLREEALFKIGTVLKTMGNNQGAAAAFKELLLQNSKSKRAGEVKKILAALDDS